MCKKTLKNFSLPPIMSSKYEMESGWKMENIKQLVFLYSRMVHFVDFCDWTYNILHTYQLIFNDVLL